MADRRRLTANLAAVGLLVAVAAGVLVWRHPWRAAEPSSVGSIPDNARSLLIRQFDDLGGASSRGDFAAAAGRSKQSRTFAATVWDARARIGVTDARFVYEGGGEAADRSDGSTSARVRVTWRPSTTSVFAGFATHAATVRFHLIPRAGGFDLVSAAGSGHDRLPVWLAGPITVREHGSATLVSVGRSALCSEVGRLARRAVEGVRRVQPDATGNLLVVCPRNPGTAAALLGSRSSDLGQIASISTAVGGPAGRPGVVINPRVFATMDGRARQVIMTHEATHVLTGVIGKKPELWVAEGYADFVALHDDRAPLSVSAGQILGQVRAGGPPKTLPSAKSFNEQAHALGTSYEAAWMVFRMLAERFGDGPVTAFYRDVVSGATVEAAAQREFGWTVADLTKAWRSYLTKSASTAS